MSIRGLTDREAVEAAIREFDALGREAFLNKHGFGRCRYMLLHKQAQYDSKAIAGVAYGYQHGKVLSSDRFSGGAKAAALVLGLLPEDRQARPPGARPRRRKHKLADLLAPYRGPRKPTPRKPGPLQSIDPQTYDEANAAHERTINALAQRLEREGVTLHSDNQQDVAFDLAATRGELLLVAEAKSLPRENIQGAHVQLRLGLGQVLWYRYHADTGEKTCVAVVVVEREPPKVEDWVAACREVDVILTWPERFETLMEQAQELVEQAREAPPGRPVDPR